MKKILALILMLCTVLAASAALAETETYILYCLKNPEEETFFAGEAENFPFYAISFDSENVNAVLYNEDQGPLNGTYEVAETDDDDILLATIDFENGEQLAMYIVLSEQNLMWVDNEGWTNVMVPMSDYPDRDAAQLKLDQLNGLTTYVLTSVTKADGSVLTAENGDDIPKLALAFNSEAGICISRTEFSEHEFEYTAEADEAADTLLVSVAGPEGQTLTLTGTYSGNTLTMEDPNSGDVYTLTMAN